MDGESWHPSACPPILILITWFRYTGQSIDASTQMSKNGRLSAPPTAGQKRKTEKTPQDWWNPNSHPHLSGIAALVSPKIQNSLHYLVTCICKLGCGNRSTTKVHVQRHHCPYLCAPIVVGKVTAYEHWSFPALPPHSHSVHSHCIPVVALE